MFAQLLSLITLEEATGKLPLSDTHLPESNRSSGKKPWEEVFLRKMLLKISFLKDFASLVALMNKVHKVGHFLTVNDGSSTVWSPQHWKTCRVREWSTSNDAARTNSPHWADVWYRLLRSNKYGDLIIRCEGQILSVHRAVVCIRSDVIAEKATKRDVSDVLSRSDGKSDVSVNTYNKTGWRRLRIRHEQRSTRDCTGIRRLPVLGTIWIHASIVATR